MNPLSEVLATGLNKIIQRTTVCKQLGTTAIYLDDILGLAIWDEFIALLDVLSPAIETKDLRSNA